MKEAFSSVHPFQFRRRPLQIQILPSEEAPTSSVFVAALMSFGTECESTEVGRFLYTIGRVHFRLTVRVDRENGLTVRGGGRDLN